MRNLSLALAAIATASLGGIGKANATITTVATPSTVAPANGMMSTYSGVTTLTFNGSMVLPSQLSGGVVVNGNSPGNFAAPSGDTSNFYAVGAPPNYTGSSTFTPGAVENYFGVYWGSIDTYNTITFSLNGTNVGTFTGANFPPANGNQAATGTNEFVDFLFSAGTGYDKVMFTTTSANLEVDNIAFGTVQVPEPASIMLLGTGLLAIGSLARRRA